jgi:uncharacterized protein (TIGR03437 family)
MTYGGTNAPDTYSAKTTFSSTPVVVDNGAVKIWQVQTPTSATAEWDVFYMQTVNGGPLAGNINSLWNILIDYTLTAPVYFDQVAMQWLVNGTPVSPLTNGIGSICCAATSNPILPGAAYYNSGFKAPYPAGLFSASDNGMLWQQVFATPYSIVSNGGINPNTANGFYFALHFSEQAPVPAVTGVVSAGQFGGFKSFAPGSWIEIYGSNLAAVTQTWSAADFNGVLAPTTLGGTSVTIGGQNAFVDYVSPGQVNVQVPGGLSPGPLPLLLTTSGGSSAPFSTTLNSTMPGLLAPSSFNVGGTQYVVAQYANGSFVAPPGSIAGATTQRAHAGDTVLMYGIGFGTVSPSNPPGQITELTNNLTSALNISIGGTSATTSYAGLAPTFVGLYQFNVVIPSIAASDKAPVTFTLNGAAGTQTLALAVQ